MLVTYFNYIKKFQNSYSTYHKPNGGIDVFKMKHKKLFNLFSCVCVKIVIFLNGILGKRIFWSNLPCLDLNDLPCVHIYFTTKKI